MVVDSVVKNALLVQVDAFITCGACPKDFKDSLSAFLDGGADSSAACDRGITRSEAASMMGVCCLTVSRLLTSGKLRGFGCGGGGVSGKRRFTRVSFRSVQDFMKSGCSVG